MTFFYSAIGILLFSSIVLVNKYILLLDNNNFSGLASNYPESQYKQNDKFFLSTLYSGQDFGEGTNICFNLKKEFMLSGFQNNSKLEYFQDESSPSLHEDIINSCVLTDGFHRILVKKNSYSPIKYSYNSCILDKKIICSFEEGGN